MIYQVVRIVNQSGFIEEEIKVLLDKLNNGWDLVNIHNGKDISLYLIKK